MPHVIEPAASGRAKCRGCQRLIAKDELRFGERVPNPFAAEDGAETTLWFHLRCAAFKRPEALLEVLDEHALPEQELLRREASLGVEHRRLPRIDGAEAARSGRAKCRDCHEPIPKGAWRVRLVWYEEGRFEPSGFVHAGCARSYFGTDAFLARIEHFGTGLGPSEREQLARALRVA